MLCFRSPAGVSSTPSTTLSNIIGLDSYTQLDDYESNRMQLGDSSSADSLYSSVESTDLSSGDTTATDIELDSGSDRGSEKVEDSHEEASREIELDSDNDSDNVESAGREVEADAEQDSTDEEDYMITNGTSEPDEMPLQQSILPTFHSGNMLLRKGKTVELNSGDFLRIRLIVQADTTEVYLHGLRFQRSHKLDGIVTKHANEVIWVEEIFIDGSVEEEEIPLGQVLRIRKLRMTNKRYESLNLKHTIKWPPTTILYKDEGILFCRMKYEVLYKDQAQKAKDNSFSFVEKCVRNLASEETDGESWEDPADLRADYRGDESPTMRRLRRSVSSMTLLGEPELNGDDDVQEVPNPTARHKPYTFGDVFCGGGGMSCGAQLAGLMVRWGLDFNIDAMRTYQLNFKDATGECTSVEHFLNASIYPPAQYHVDVLHMSPPCQSFSPAQTVKPEDFEDKQVVILAVNDLVKMIKPRIITMEETFGLLHEVNRAFFKCVVNSLTEQGYSVRWKVMNFIEYGVPQARRRVVLIAAGPGETLPAFPAPTHINNPQTIASTINNIPSNAPNHHPKDLPYPKRPYDANNPLRSLIATAGGDDNYHPSGHRGFTEREFACLQTFPRDFVFVGTRTAVVRQIGNAVPPLPGKTIYEEVIRTLRRTDEAEGM